MANSGARVYRSTNQSVSSGFTAIQFNTEIYDVGDYFDAGTPTHLTIPEDGYYFISGGIQSNFVYQYPSNYYRGVFIRKNGTTYIAGTKFYAGTDARQHVSCMHEFSAGDYIEIMSYIGSGGGSTITGGSYVYCSIQKIAIESVDVGARVYEASSGTLIPNAAWTAVTFTSERYDTHDLHDNSVNPGRFTIPVGYDGVYLIGSSIQVTGTANGYSGISILLNGTGIAIEYLPLNNGLQRAHVINTAYDLDAGDYLEVKVYQNSGANRYADLQGDYSPEFWIQRIGS